MIIALLMLLLPWSWSACGREKIVRNKGYDPNAVSEPRRNPVNGFALTDVSALPRCPLLVSGSALQLGAGVRDVLPLGRGRLALLSVNSGVEFWERSGNELSPIGLLDTKFSSSGGTRREVFSTHLSGTELSEELAGLVEFDHRTDGVQFRIVLRQNIEIKKVSEGKLPGRRVSGWRPTGPRKGLLAVEIAPAVGQFVEIDWSEAEIAVAEQGTFPLPNASGRNWLAGISQLEDGFVYVLTSESAKWSGVLGFDAAVYRTHLRWSKPLLLYEGKLEGFWADQETVYLSLDVLPELAQHPLFAEFSGGGLWELENDLTQPLRWRRAMAQDVLGVSTETNRLQVIFSQEALDRSGFALAVNSIEFPAGAQSPGEGVVDEGSRCRVSGLKIVRLINGLGWIGLTETDNLVLISPEAVP